MQTRKTSYTYDYPEAIAYAEAQGDVGWLAKDVDVSKDIQDMRVNMSAAKVHGITTTLKLFTLYELVAGRDYWLGRFMRMFPRPDLERLGAEFGRTELCTHAPFYNAINEALMINTDEFYTDYVNSPTLAARMDFVESIVCHEDDLVSMGAFSMVEGGVLYSAFAFLKSFQTEGNSELLNVVRGINYSVRDENLHCEAGAWAYRQLKAEKLAAGLITRVDVNRIESSLIAAVKQLCEHEHEIVDMIFAEGEMDNINKDDLKRFINSRMNHVLALLEIYPVFTDVENTISKWFYKNINAVQFNDQFSGIGISYNNSWNKEGFLWLPPTTS